MIDPDTDRDDRVDHVIGRSPGDAAIFKEVGRIAAQDVTVLILGESGTGKELIARAIYDHSRRSDQAFLAINCAAIPETLLESELFGHEKGAFTGADRVRIGKFEQAQQGTLFLDEIGDAAPATQAKILARAAGRKVRARRRQRDDSRRRADHRRHQQGPRAGDAARRNSARTCSFG